VQTSSTRADAVAALQHVPLRDAALDKITEVLDQEPQVRDAAGARDLPRSKARALRRRRFTYGTGRRCCTGSTSMCPDDGRARRPHRRRQSTIAKLLARFYDPSRGG